MLYLRLILRSLSKSRKRDYTFYILLILCITAIIFCLNFKNSFYKQYVNLGIDMYTGHLNIVSPLSPKIGYNSWGSRSDDLPLIEINKDIENLIQGINYVDYYTPIIETSGPFYTLNGEQQGRTGITGIEPRRLIELFPARKVISGDVNFKYSKSMTDIPVLRRKVTRSEEVINNDKFVEEDFKYSNDKFEKFKTLFIRDFSYLFINTKGNIDKREFIIILNRALKDPDLFKQIPSKYKEKYNVSLSDVLYNIKNIDNSKSNYEKELAKWNKRLFQAIYPYMIYTVPEEVSLYKPMTLSLPPAKSNSDFSLPIIIPIEFIGFVEYMPQYFNYDSFIDIEVLRKYLNLSKDQCTSIVIRLKNIKNVEKTKTIINNFLKKNRYNYVVLDYKELGQAHLSITTATNIILYVLIIFFILIVIIFVINMVMVSIMRRKREIGTTISLGLSKQENILIFIGEVFFILTLCWIIGIVLGSILVFIFQDIGIPGVVFFINNKLYLLYKIKYLFLAYLYIIIPAMISCIIPCFSINKTTIVSLLKDIS